MATNYVGEGKVIDYTAGAAISAGDTVVIGTVSGMLGIALTDIANGDTGAVAVEGIFTIPKVSGAVFAQGDQVLLDVSVTPDSVDDNSATPATGDFWCGTAAVAGANGETTAQIKLNGYATTKT